MIETIDLPANLPLGGAWQDKETQKLYFQLGEKLMAARVGNVSQGRAALCLVDSLPEDAAALDLPAGYDGAEVRRILVCCPAGDDEEELVLALDLGRDRYLSFVLEGECATEARRMHPAASCGEVECEIRHAARFPERVELPAEVVKRSRLCLRLFGFCAAMLLSSAVCGFLLNESWVVRGMLVLAFLLCGMGFVLMKRPAVCPWCGEKSLFLGDYNRMTCHSCNYDCALPGKNNR